jgi:hypothetical protein
VALANLGAWDAAEEHLEKVLRFGRDNADVRRLLQAVRQARAQGFEVSPP